MTKISSSRKFNTKNYSELSSQKLKSFYSTQKFSTKSISSQKSARICCYKKLFQSSIFLALSSRNPIFLPISQFFDISRKFPLLQQISRSKTKIFSSILTLKTQSGISTIRTTRLEIKPKIFALKRYSSKFCRKKSSEKLMNFVRQILFLAEGRKISSKKV